MKKTSNRKCSELVGDLIEFKASNLHSEWVGHHYVVFSYGWFPLFIYDDRAKKAYFNEKKYSPSTSRQAMYVQRDLDWKRNKMNDEMFDTFKKTFRTIDR